MSCGTSRARAGAQRTSPGISTTTRAEVRRCLRRWRSARTRRSRRRLPSSPRTRACSPPPRKVDAATIAKLASTGANVNAKDARGRTPLHVAAFMKQRDAMKALVDAGRRSQRARRRPLRHGDDRRGRRRSRHARSRAELGNRATNVTSRYDGTALIAAAHLGHVEVVRILVKAGAPLDHVNNLGGRRSSSPSSWATAARATRRRSTRSSKPART